MFTTACEKRGQTDASQRASIEQPTSVASTRDPCSGMNLVRKLKEQASRPKRELHALWLAYHDPRTPWLARALIVCVIAYALSPIDLIPDPIPIIGHLDDLILLPLGIALIIRMIPDSVMTDCRERAGRASFDRPSQWKWIGAAFVVIVWLSIAMWMWRMIHRQT
jgi:uncharacterized membrane protein YkvA (DUF1232 family)